jgi:hypothetical protein
LGAKVPIDDKTRAKLCTALKAGAPLWLACKFSGISPDKLRDHMKFDVLLQAEVEKAEAEAAMFFIMNLRKHAEDDPKVSMFWLERRMRKEFGPKIEVDSTKKVFTITMGNPKTMEAQEQSALPQGDVIDADYAEDEE